MDLNEWVLILNRMDAFLEQVTADHPGMWLPEKAGGTADSPPPAPVDKNVIDSVATALKFTSSLLNNCYNKEIYSSTEVKMSF
jgi:hypothetical protein